MPCFILIKYGAFEQTAAQVFWWSGCRIFFYP